MAQPEIREKKHKLNPVAAFCLRHAIHPAMMVLAFLLVFSLLGSTVYFGLLSIARPNDVVESRVVRFGFEDIGELVTQSGYFTNVQVLESDREIFGVAVPFTHNKYIYSYDGVIKAGINFSQVSVKVDEEAKTIQVYLPQVRVLGSEIDETSLRVYDEVKNVFNPLKLAEVNLSLVKLKEEVQKTAIENGLLENARHNAESIVKGFISEFYNVKDYELIFN